MLKEIVLEALGVARAGITLDAEQKPHAGVEHEHRRQLAARQDDVGDRHLLEVRASISRWSMPSKPASTSRGPDASARTRSCRIGAPRGVMTRRGPAEVVQWGASRRWRRRARRRARPCRGRRRPACRRPSGADRRRSRGCRPPRATMRRRLARGRRLSPSTPGKGFREQGEDGGAKVMAQCARKRRRMRPSFRGASASEQARNP